MHRYRVTYNYFDYSSPALGFVDREAELPAFSAEDALTQFRLKFATEKQDRFNLCNMQITGIEPLEELG